MAKRNPVIKTKSKNPAIQAMMKQVAKPAPKKTSRPAKGLFSALGGMAGGYLGGPVGGVLGSKAGDLLAKITGFGAYTVNKNSLVGGNTVPTFRATTEGVEISHREFIGDVTGNVAFTIASFPINPGLAVTFPWLSTVAKNFEEYDMLGLVFEYRPSSGSAISTSSAALGTVIYATDYNALAPRFRTKQAMESYEFSSSTVPFEGMLHPVECQNQSNVLDTLYVRTASAPASGEDIRMSDLGQFELAVVGMQSAYIVGELWVSYHIKLKKPRINPAGSGVYAHITEYPSASASTAHPLGTTGGVFSSQSNLPGVSIGPTGGTVLFSQPGNYYFSLSMQTSGTGMAGVTYTLGSNITDDNAGIWDDAKNADIGIQSSDTKNQVLNGTLLVSDIGTSAANMFTPAGYGNCTTAAVDLFLFPVPYAFN